MYVRLVDHDYAIFKICIVATRGVFELALDRERVMEAYPSADLKLQS